MEIYIKIGLILLALIAISFGIYFLIKKKDSKDSKDSKSGDKGNWSDSDKKRLISTFKINNSPLSDDQIMCLVNTVSKKYSVKESNTFSLNIPQDLIKDLKTSCNIDYTPPVTKNDGTPGNWSKTMMQNYAKIIKNSYPLITLPCFIYYIASQKNYQDVLANDIIQDKKFILNMMNSCNIPSTWTDELIEMMSKNDSGRGPTQQCTKCFIDYLRSQMSVEDALTIPTDTILKTFKDLAKSTCASPCNISPNPPKPQNQCFASDDDCKKININNITPMQMEQCAKYILNMPNGNPSFQEEACDAVRSMLTDSSITEDCRQQYSQITSTCGGDINPSNKDKCIELLTGKDCINNIENVKDPNYKQYLQCYKNKMQQDADSKYINNASNCVEQCRQGEYYEGCEKMCNTACGQVVYPKA